MKKFYPILIVFFLISCQLPEKPYEESVAKTRIIEEIVRMSETPLPSFAAPELKITTDGPTTTHIFETQTPQPTLTTPFPESYSIATPVYNINREEFQTFLEDKYQIKCESKVYPHHRTFCDLSQSPFAYDGNTRKYSILYIVIEGRFFNYFDYISVLYVPNSNSKSYQTGVEFLTSIIDEISILDEFQKKEAHFILGMCSNEMKNIKSKRTEINEVYSRMTCDKYRLEFQAGDKP